MSVPRSPDLVGWPAELAERYRAAGYWRGETFGAVLRARAEDHPDRIAVVDRTRPISYGALDRRADGLAAALAGLGIARGERVVVQLPNVVELFEVLFALFRLGAIPICALPVHRHSELHAFCALSDAVALVTCDRLMGFEHRELAAELQRELPALAHVLIAGEPAAGQLALAGLDGPAAPLVGPDPSDVALLQLSGGTTGTPKLIPRTHDDYLYTARACLEHADFGPDDVYLAALPVVHNFPLISPGALGALAAGGRVVLAPTPSPEVCLALIESERVTHSSVVPPVALLWLTAAERAGCPDLSSLRVLQVGGAKCSAEVAARIRPTLGATLQQMFGMAEGLINCTRLDDPDEVIVETQGRPVSPADEVRIVDEHDRDVAPGQAGRLLARGPYTIRGYYRAREHDATAFTADGYYRTGDVVRMTAEGNLVVEGRVKDQINRGGEKIAAEEIENQLLAHPAVHDAAVVSMPDALLGERTCAFVVPRAGRAPAPTSGELLAFLRGRRLAAYKIPDRLELVDAFPVVGIGKTSKRDLRAAIAATLRAPTTPDPEPR